jgi:hypothetical protein
VHLRGVEKEMNNEPVAWAVWEGRPHDLFFTKEEADELCRLKGGDAKSIPLYTEQTWQYLTDDEIKEIVGSHGDGIGGYTRDLFDKIEAKIRKKNETKRTVETR